MESAALVSAISMAFFSIPVRLSPQELRHAMRSSGLHSSSSQVYLCGKFIRVGPAYRKSRL